MIERPILFSGPMVRAVLEGRKTQTRHVIAKQPGNGWDFDVPAQFGRITSTHPKKGRFGVFIRHGVDTDFPSFDLIPCPYGMPGDRLWVRETWQHSNHPFGPYESDCIVFYRADYLDDPLGPDLERSADGIRREWRPSIHMPRGAGRITLEITGVSVERLNDCSEDDARAEGSEAIGITFRRDVDGKPHLIESLGGPYRDGFRILWESINGAGAWNSNPWVWVIQFRRIHGSENR
ncbi:hypothetical protein MK974_24415 [Burkholderia ambifaria]|uniref:hypothetical protein n=1 Tax=Burkholderia ambifaria TaxID=152480 RepID=UPI0022A9B63D|nr:hypothetical protein [Burkholderia ambifaria]WAS56247.1 hypothetical protein MK974_24415 [Burkholderia ambifaria]